MSTPNLDFLQIGDIKVSNKPSANFAVDNLTSGVLLLIYDSANTVGGVAYIFLPDSKMAGPIEEENEGKFADLAVPRLLEEFAAAGGQQSSATVRLIGGSQLFNFGGGGANSMNVGNRNELAIRNILSNQGWVIGNCDIGGNKGRKVKFSIENGRVMVGQTGQDPYEL